MGMTAEHAMRGGRERLRVGLVADTHGCLDSRVAAALSRCEYIVHAGDIGGAGVLAGLRAAAEVVLAVRGNNDTPGKWPAEEGLLLTSLPLENRLTLPGGDLCVVHGDRFLPAGQRHALLRSRFAGARAVVYGHSHRLVCDLDGMPWVLNPGAGGKDRTFGGPSCLILTVSALSWDLEVKRFPDSRRKNRGAPAFTRAAVRRAD